MPVPNDWLAALAGNQYGTGSGANPAGLMPGGGAMGYPAASGGGPNMGYPAMNAGMPMGQPTQQPPAAQPPPAPAQQTPWFSVGAPNFANAVNPEFWQDLAAAKHYGSVGAAKLATLLGGIGAGGVNPSGQADPSGAYPAPPANMFPGGGGAQAAPAPAPLDLSGRASFPARPPSPYGTGIYPAAAGAQAYESNFPGSPSAAPAGSPSATPRPAGALAANPPIPPPRPQAAANPAAGPNARRNPRFSTVQYNVPGSGRGNAPIYTALNLFGGQ